MMTHSKRLKRRVESYLKYLTKPNPGYNNQPICPGLAPYRHEIQLLMAQGDLEAQINQIADVLYPLNIPAAIIYTGMPPTDLWDITDRCLQDRENIEIFISEPDRKGKTRGVFTGFESGTLIIVQRLDLLIKARELAKKTGYYNQKTQDE